jgi:DNA polymerase elongation subunit (family B)
MTVQATGAYFDGRDIVYWTRSSTGERELHRARAEHACYLSASKTPAEVVERLRASSVVRSLKADGDWLRLSVRDRDVLYRIAAPRVKGHDGETHPGLLAGFGVPSYEADLDPVRRWALENSVEVVEPRRCYLDLECDSRVPLSKKESARILSWSLGDDSHDPWNPGCPDGLVTAVLEEDTDEAERELLLDLLEELEPYDQVAAWYGDGYDFPVLRARLERQRVHVDERRWLLVDHLPVFRRMNISSSKSGDEKQSMSLDSIAQSVAGMRKFEFDSSRTWDEWAAGGARRAGLGRYNAHDVRLMIAIERRTGYLELHNVVSQTCGVFPDTRASNPLRYVDNMMLRLARSRGLRLPTMFGKGDDADEQFTGAYVMEPVKGILRDVHVVDFASMYPSIIRSWNMSHETLTEHALEEGPRPSYLLHAPRAEKRPVPAGCCESPSGAVFRTEPEGLLSVAVGEALRLRKYWTRLKASFPPESPEWIDADRRSTGYKIVGNTFFGVASCRYFRCFSEEVGEGITKAGQWMIKLVAAEVEKRGMRPVAGDTDSSFITDTTGDAMRAFVEWCNAELFPAELRKMGAPRCELRLEYEKAHEVMLSVGKKRYAARYAHYKGQAPDASTKPEVKGLEYKRGDTSRLARAMQAEVIDLMLGGGVLGPRRAEVCLERQIFWDLVCRWRERVLDGELRREDVILSKRLTKPLDAYTRRTRKDGGFAGQPPHVEVARVLRDRGTPVAEGFKVDYFVRDGSTTPARVLPAVDWDGEFDRYYLWEQLVYPPTQRVLEVAFPAGGWEQHERVRPRKVRGVLPGQSGFGFGEAPAPRPAVASTGPDETPKRPDHARGRAVAE